MISQYYVSRGIQLHKDVMSKFALSKREVYDTINAELLNVFTLTRSQVLTQLHGEARRQILLVLNVVGRVDANA